MRNATWTRLLMAMAPAAFVVAVVAVVLDTRVEGLDGTWLILFVTGVAGAALMMLASGRSSAVGVAAASATQVEASSRTVPAAVASAGREDDAMPAAPRRAAPTTSTAGPPNRLTCEAFSLAKIGEPLDRCEDAFAHDLRRGRFAVADGASSSFGARQWARILVDGFVADPPPPLSPNDLLTWLSKRSTTWDELDQGAPGDWFNEAASQRGAYATLLGVQVMRGKNGRTLWHATAAGDSCLFHVRGQALVTSFPVEPGGSFGSHPVLLGTPCSDAVDIAAVRWAAGDLRAGDVLLLATDALAEWAMHDDDRRHFLATADLDEVRARVDAARAKKAIVNDDLTLVRVGAHAR